MPFSVPLTVPYCWLTNQGIRKFSAADLPVRQSATMSNPLGGGRWSGGSAGAVGAEAGSYGVIAD